MTIRIKDLKKLFPNHSVSLPDDLEIAFVTQDTRQLKNQALYVALVGERFDGHDFLKEAFQKGAAAALVSQNPENLPNCFVCDDAVSALGRLGAWHRSQFTQPVLAITGSSGKTTTKEFLAHVLGQEDLVIATKGNLNNHIGVPLTLCRFTSDAKFFVVEMGMNHFEEIRYLAKMARPNLAFVTCVGRSHIENVGGTLAGVAKAKGELFEELSQDAIAIVNADDPWILQMPTQAKRVLVGSDSKCDYQISHVVHSAENSLFTISFASQKVDLKIRLVGDHHVKNAAQIFAASFEMGVPLQKIVSGIESFEMSFNRGRSFVWKGHHFVDDTYNANPDSMRAALSSFSVQYKDFDKIAVLGGMLELGEASPELHKEVGEFARQKGILAIYAFGNFADRYLQKNQDFAAQFSSGHFKTHEDLAESLQKFLDSREKPVAVLFKGSRGMRMETVLNLLIGEKDSFSH